jgi:hypothetical protein
MKKWLLILNILLNSITILLFIDLGSFDSMENHLANGGIVISRPITYAAFGTVSLIFSTIISIYYLFFFSQKE